MKRISLFSHVLILFLFACKNDETLVTIKSNATPPVIAASSSGITKVITSSNMADALNFTWSAADYGVETQVTYTLQLDSKCNTFTSPVIVGTTPATNFSITLTDLNSKLLGTLQVAANRAANLELRVTASINGKYITTSATAPLTVTPFSDQPLVLWLGEGAPSAPTLFSTGSHTYESYRNIAAPTSFRLSENPICSDSVFGSGGAGKLAVGTTAPVITMAHKGYYKFDVDTKTLVFDTVFISTWGMIGSATPLGWDASTPMTYNSTSDTWSGTITLVPGAIKFRANNDWGINYGPASSDALNGTLVTTDDAVTIAEQGVYIVTIDFSQSKSPYAFNYTIAKSSDVPEPSKLWLPGGYEGFNPAAAPTIYAISPTVYEGYVNIPSGTGFKFTSAPDYNHINYGDSGTPGVLSTDGLASDLSLGVAGYYKLTADIKNLTYGVYLVNSWGLIGTATPGQWDNSSPMTFDPTRNVWTATMDLVNGALKFRANNAWDLNYGPASTTDLLGTLIQTNDAISIPVDGNYTVTLDFSRSSSPYEYTYTVVKN